MTIELTEFEICLIKRGLLVLEKQCLHKFLGRLSLVGDAQKELDAISRLLNERLNKTK